MTTTATITRNDANDQATADTIKKQIGWHAKACMGVPRGGMKFGIRNGNVYLQVKTTGCGSNGVVNRGRFVEVTYVAGCDTYTVEGYTVRGADLKVKFTLENVHAQELGDVCINAADAR